MSYCYDFLKDAALDVKIVHLIFTNSQLRGSGFISVEVFLQRHAAPRLQRVSAQLIDAHQVKKLLCQQFWLAGRCKTLTARVSYADTHCACIIVTDKEHSALLGTHTNFACVQLRIQANQENPFYIESVPT
jgi:hypothetical protein